MSVLKSGIHWFQQTFGWSNNRFVWLERAAVLGFVLVAAGLIYLSATWFAVWQAVIAWSVYALVLTVCCQQGWIKLFGPVLFYDMVRTSRRSRYVVMRLLYAGVLLTILCFMYLTVVAKRGGGRHPEAMLFAVIGFFVFMIAEIVLVALLMLVSSRGARIALFALLIVAMLLFGCGFLIFDMQAGRGFQQDNPNMRPEQQRLASAVLAELFFSVFMLVQIVLVVLLTPAYVAGAIAEEKDRKTLEFLLATDLHNREIVLSKLLSRVANMTLLLLTGVPILSILQFIGGVDTQLMLAGFAGTALTIFGIASMSILLSTLFKKPRDAIGLAYLLLIAYIGLGTTTFAHEVKGYFLMNEKIWESPNAPTYGDASRWFNAGNPVSTCAEVALAIDGYTRTRTRTTLAAVLPEIMERYVWFHIPLGIICIAWSILRVRAIALKQTSGGKTEKVSWWQRFRPPIGELPMLWKEFHIEGAARLNWLSIVAGTVLVLLTLGSGILVMGHYFWELNVNPGARWRTLSETMNIWFRFAGTCVSCLLILHVGVRASTAISSERERDTFDALIATPLSDVAILGAKVLGSMTSLRLAWVWFGSILLLGISTGAVHLLAVPIIIMAWFIYAFFFTMVGLWYSMVCKSSLRATVFTVLTTLAVGGGHWLLTLLCCFPVFAIMRVDHPGEFPEYFLMFQAGMTPPFVFAFCSFSWLELSADHWRHNEFVKLFTFSIIGLFLWAIGCVVFWFGVLVPKFREITRREELLYE